MDKHDEEEDCYQFIFKTNHKIGGVGRKRTSGATSLINSLNCQKMRNTLFLWNMKTWTDTHIDAHKRSINFISRFVGGGIWDWIIWKVINMREVPDLIHHTSSLHRASRRTRGANVDSLGKWGYVWSRKKNGKIKIAETLRWKMCKHFDKSCTKYWDKHCQRHNGPRIFGP